MRVMPLAADSLGVRSMATYVEAGPVRFLIDPGATLSPRRYGLAADSGEEEALARARLRIEAYAVRATPWPSATSTPITSGRIRACTPGGASGRRIRGERSIAIRRPRAESSGGSSAPTARLEPAEGQQVEVDGVTIRFSRRSPTGRRARSSATSWRSRWTTAAVRPRVGPAGAGVSRRDGVSASGAPGPRVPFGPADISAEPGRARRGAARDRQPLRMVRETGCRVIMDHHAVREPRFRERLARRSTPDG